MDDGLKELLIDLSHSMLAQLLLDLFLFLSQTSEVSSPQLACKSFQVRLIQSLPLQYGFKSIGITSWQQWQEFCNLLTGQFVSDHFRRKYLREINLQYATWHLYMLLFIGKCECSTVKYVFVVVFNRMRVGVWQGVSKGLYLVLQSLLDVGIDAGTVVIVLGPVEQVRHN